MKPISVLAEEAKRVNDEINRWRENHRKVHPDGSQVPEDPAAEVRALRRLLGYPASVPFVIKLK